MMVREYIIAWCAFLGIAKCTIKIIAPDELTYDPVKVFARSIPAEGDPVEHPQRCVENAIELLRNGHYLAFCDHMNSMRKQYEESQAKSKTPALQVVVSEKDNLAMTFANILLSGLLPQELKEKIIVAYLSFHSKRFTELADMIDLIRIKAKCPSWDAASAPCPQYLKLILDNFPPQLKKDPIFKSPDLQKREVAQLIKKTEAEAAILALADTKKSPLSTTINSDQVDEPLTPQDRVELFNRFFKTKNWKSLLKYLNIFLPEDSPHSDKNFYLKKAGASIDPLLEGHLFRALMNLIGTPAQINASEVQAIIKQKIYQDVICSQLRNDEGKLLSFLILAALHPQKALGYQLAELAIVECHIDSQEVHNRVMDKLKAIPALAIVQESSVFDFAYFRGQRALDQMNQLFKKPLLTLEEYTGLLEKMEFLQDAQVGPQAYSLFQETFFKAPNEELCKAFIGELLKTKPFTQKSLATSPIFMKMVMDSLGDIPDTKDSKRASWILETICEGGKCMGIMAKILNYARTQLKIDDDNKDQRLEHIMTKKKDLRKNLQSILSNLKTAIRQKTLPLARIRYDITTADGEDALNKKIHKDLAKALNTTLSCKLALGDAPGIWDLPEARALMDFPMELAFSLTKYPETSFLSSSLKEHYSHTFIKEAIEGPIDLSYLSFLLMMAVDRGSYWGITHILSVAPPAFNSTSGFKYYLWRLIIGVGREFSDYKMINLTNLYNFPVMKFTQVEGLSAKLMFLACQNHRCPLPRADLDYDSSAKLDKISEIGSITPEELVAYKEGAAKAGTKPTPAPPPETFPEKLLAFQVKQLQDVADPSVRNRAEWFAKTFNVLTAFMNARYEWFIPYIYWGLLKPV